MNAYTLKFFAPCPTNDVRIEYRWRLELAHVAQVEDLISHAESYARHPVYHEALADDLWRKYGGRQVLTADHHGVTIETHRPSAQPKEPQ